MSWLQGRTIRQDRATEKLRLVFCNCGRLLGPLGRGLNEVIGRVWSHRAIVKLQIVRHTKATAILRIYQSIERVKQAKPGVIDILGPENLITFLIFSRISGV